MSLSRLLSQAHWFSRGKEVVSLPLGADRIEPHVQRLLCEKGFLRAPYPLDHLHEVLPAAQIELDENYLNVVTRAFYQHDAGLLSAYHDTLRALRPRIGEDFVFQAAPILRFHFPARFSGKLRTQSGLGLQQHSDTLGGHPFELLHGWLPLCSCEGTAALHVSSREDGIAILSRFFANIGFDEAQYRHGLDAFYRERDCDEVLQQAIRRACTPCAMQRGDLLLFEPRCVHGGVENSGSCTRVSVDFRLMPVSVYDAFVHEPHAAQHPRFRRGQLFHAATIDAL